MKAHYSILFSGLLGLSVNAQAQAPQVLTLAGYTQPIGIDTLSLPITNAPFAALLTPAVNASWNFSQTNHNGSGYIEARIAPGLPNPYPGSTFYTLRDFPFASGLRYTVRMFNTLNAMALSVPGEIISSRQPLALGGTTGNPNDSLVFQAQNVPYNVPEKVIVFPATFKSGWNSTIKSTTSFKLTVASAMINNAPGERRSQRSRIDTVIGWGTVVLQNANNTGATAPIPVLQVRTAVIVRDSFYLNGQPAPMPLLSAFGLAQGNLDTLLHIFLYRVGETTPLVQAKWNSSSFTGTPADVYIHKQNLPAPSSVSNTPASTAFTLSPNPVRRGQALQFTIGNGNWNATVLNIMGQAVATQKGTSSGGTQSFELPDALPAGTYFLQLQSGEKALTVQSFVRID